MSQILVGARVEAVVLARYVYAGRDLETVVLARAARWHLINRVLVYRYKTVESGADGDPW
jgi:hypothetical protein